MKYNSGKIPIEIIFFFQMRVIFENLLIFKIPSEVIFQLKYLQDPYLYYDLFFPVWVIFARRSGSVERNLHM